MPSSEVKLGYAEVLRLARRWLEREPGITFRQASIRIRKFRNLPDLCPIVWGRALFAVSPERCRK